MIIIKINCTSMDDLSFHGKKIRKESYNKIANSLNTIDELERIQIVYKKQLNKPSTSKTIEFFIKINNESYDTTSKMFVFKLKANGFNSKNNTNILIIDRLSNNVILVYEFISLNKKAPASNNKINNAHYRTFILYKKT